MKASIYCFVLLLSFICSQTPYDDLINWSKKNKIYVHPDLALNKTNHNEYYFHAKSNINSNTLILSIPERILITANSLYSKSKSKKLKRLWEKLLDTQSNYITATSTKEMMFIAVIIEHSMRKQKGAFYSKYKAYINSFPENMDNFPMYYSNEEQSLLKHTHFYADVFQAKMSLEEEEQIINRNLSHPMFSDDYWKYRVITLANSLTIQNKTTLVPLLNLFIKDIEENQINAQWTYNATTNQFEIYSKRNISPHQMIILQGMTIPNSVSLLYYGFTCERNEYIAQMMVDVIHKKFKDKLNYDYNVTLYKTSYDLGKQEFVTDIIDVYRILAIKYGYGSNDSDIYRMMIDNLEYYFKEYDNIKESDYVKMIISKRNRINIKRVVELEKRVFQAKIKYLKTLISKTKADL